MPCVPTDVGVRTEVPIVADVEPPIERIGCTRESVEVGVAVLIPAIPTVGCVEVPIVGTDDGVLVDAPIVGVVEVRLVGVPTVERVVPVATDDVVPESVVVVDPVVPSEVSGGSTVAEGPTPSLAANELKSVGAPNPRVASKASKSGSAAAGMITPVSGGKFSVVVGTVDVVVAVPLGVPPGPVADVEVCANATQGVAMSATGAIHPMILFIRPPCRMSTTGSTNADVSSSARRRDRWTI
jgi:hypothetical protein